MSNLLSIYLRNRIPKYILKVVDYDHSFAGISYPLICVWTSVLCLYVYNKILYLRMYEHNRWYRLYIMCI